MALPTRAEAEAALPDADADMGGVGSSGNTRHANMLNSSSSSSSSSCPKWRMESGERRVCRVCREWKTPLKLIMLLKSMTDYDDDDCAQDLDLVFGFCFCFSAFFLHCSIEFCQRQVSSLLSCMLIKRFACPPSPHHSSTLLFSQLHLHMMLQLCFVSFSKSISIKLLRN